MKNINVCDIKCTYMTMCSGNKIKIWNLTVPNQWTTAFTSITVHSLTITYFFWEVCQINFLCLRTIQKKYSRLVVLNTPACVCVCNFSDPAGYQDSARRAEMGSQSFRGRGEWELPVLFSFFLFILYEYTVYNLFSLWKTHSHTLSRSSRAHAHARSGNCK